ncbi:MAG: alpha/beta hydrolase [Dehalococcoidia bacterium]
MRVLLRALLLSALVGALSLTAARPSLAADRYLDEVFLSANVTSNIAYGQALDEFGQMETLRLDVYQPAGDTATDRPVVIFAHGGGFTGGSKTSPDAVNYATQMAKRGFVSASINYRLREGGFPPEEQIQVVFDAKHDAQAAVRWFRANAASYNIDADRISFAGYSAGAATALLVGYTPEDPGDSGNPGYPSDVAAVIDISGSLAGFADYLMDAGEPPVLIVHGTSDATVPYSAATEIVAAAQADSIPYELHTLDGVGHSKFSLLTDEIAEWSGAFLYHQVIANSVGGVAELPRIAGDPQMTPRSDGVSGLEVLFIVAVVATIGAGGLVATRVRRTYGRGGG